MAAEPETGLVTDCEMTMAAGPGSTDAENGVKMAARDRFSGTADGAGPGRASRKPAGHRAGRRDQPMRRGPRGWRSTATRSYGSGEARAAYRDAGHDTVIKPGPLRPAVPGGFTIDDFTIDEQAGTVTCPAGVTRPMSQDPDSDLRRGLRTVTSGAAGGIGARAAPAGSCQPGASLSALPGSSCRIMVASPRAARPQPGLEGRGGGLIRVRRGGGNETGSAYLAGRVREWRAGGVER